MPEYRTHTLRFEKPSGTYDFLLNTKTDVFGTHTIDHWWSPLPKLKPTRAGQPEAYRTFCDAYRGICLGDRDRPGTAAQAWKGAAETHVLARLLPRVRSRGAMKVFNDARESRDTHRSLAYDCELDAFLKDMELQPMSERDFHSKLLKMQEVTSNEGSAGRLYGEFENSLLTGVPELWLEDPEEAVRQVEERWETLDQRYGRRAGHEAQKQALDILSYECAGAFRRSYSAVWSDWLLPTLLVKFDLSRHSYRFLEYWHQLIVREEEMDRNERFYPFHGHCLGLHPAAGRFMKTSRGKELIGAWLDSAVRTDFHSIIEYESWKKRLPDLPAYGRLLHGYLAACYHYEEKYGEAKLHRRRLDDPTKPPKAIHRRKRGPRQTRDDK